MKKMFRVGRNAVLCFAAMLISCSSVKIDAALPADLANDRTALLSATGPGCHPVPEVGFAVCRRPLGDAVSNDFVTFFAPKTNCERQVCTTVRVFGPDATQVAEVNFDKDGGRRNVRWSRIIDNDEFLPEHDATYFVLTRTYFQNNDGDEQMIVTRGEIRLFVYRPQARITLPSGDEVVRNYQPLDSSPGADVWAFEASHGDYRMKWSTAGRAYAGDGS